MYDRTTTDGVALPLGGYKSTLMNNWTTTNFDNDIEWLYEIDWCLVLNVNESIGLCIESIVHINANADKKTNRNQQYIYQWERLKREKLVYDEYK
jgi:hypothetical protein